MYLVLAWYMTAENLYRGTLRGAWAVVRTQRPDPVTSVNVDCINSRGDICSFGVGRPRRLHENNAHANSG